MKSNRDTFKVVILAGGSGERFWPLSTAKRPKQFLNIFGKGGSLLRQSVDRLRGLVDINNVFIITSSQLVAATRKELPELPVGNIYGEPIRRDTGAAVALAVSLCGDGMMGIFSSDQLVSDEKGFQKCVKSAIKVAQTTSRITTIGIVPNYPSTAFGYINPKSGKFVEKPDSQKARLYIKNGSLWNAGMFIGKVSVFREAFAKFAPELSVLAEMKDITSRKMARLYPKLPKISFDYAVMEKLDRVPVVKGDFGWDDVGSYVAFDKHYPHDSAGNVRDGDCRIVESSNNICISRSASISLLGVENLVVISTPGAVLVADKRRVTEMKKLFVK